jgi:hypothetical protein
MRASSSVSSRAEHLAHAGCGKRARRFAEHRLEALAYPPLFECAPKIGDMADVMWRRTSRAT